MGPIGKWLQSLNSYIDEMEKIAPLKEKLKEFKKT